MSTLQASTSNIVQNIFGIIGSARRRNVWFTFLFHILSPFTHRYTLSTDEQTPYYIITRRYLYIIIM